MQITLKKLNLTNFKGIRSKEIEFDSITNIFGRNGSGKTSVMDAFLWLFFGKDSTDRKDFEVKTLDENNQPIHRLDHEVEAVISIDGTENTIKRTLREKWVKKRGTTTPEFTGHETTFFWNDVPMQQKEFDAKIASLFSEGLFKVLTNTSYFNSLKWQDRRNVLMKMAGNISNNDIIEKISTVSNKDEVGHLINILNQGKSVEEYRKEITAKKKVIKDELAMIPSRIDEAKRAMPEPVDYLEIEKAIQVATNCIEEIDTALNNAVKASQAKQKAVLDLMNEKQRKEKRMLELEHEAKTTVDNDIYAATKRLLDQKRLHQDLAEKINRLRSEEKNIDSEVEQLEKKIEELRKEWHNVHESKIVFDESEFSCPTCKREFPDEQINEKRVEMEANFNRNKANKMASIQQDGQNLKVALESAKSKKNSILKDIEQAVQAAKECGHTNADLEKNKEQVDVLAAVNSILSNSKEYATLKAEISELDKRIEQPQEAVSDDSELIVEKRKLQTELDGLKIQLSKRNDEAKCMARIKELEDSESVMAQKLATLEGQEFIVEQFNKAKMDILESRINGKFRIAKFKMFDTQINGGTVECCETLINGVPYPDANTASKVQVGLDIINALSEHYNIYAPVWCDNRESVTVLPETKSQLISLIVSASDKILRVETNALEAVA